MLNIKKTALRLTLVVPLATTLLLGSMYAAAPARADAVHGQVDHRQTFYSDAAKTNQVGVAYYYCDGDYTLTGYVTSYYKIVYYTPPCP